MSDHVSSHDLATALRTAITAYDYLDQEDVIAECTAVLDRYNEQRRADLGKYAADLTDNRNSTMLRAKWARDQGRKDFAAHLVRLAHDYNRRAIRLRREIRGIGGAS